MRKITIYTDGSCYPNPGSGGWAVILTDVATGKEKILQGGKSNTTISVMELTAAVEAIEALKANCEVEFYTDSQYVQKGITIWIGAWKQKDWPSKIKNQKLWRRLDRARMMHNINWIWVRSHNGNPGNERVDNLAKEAGLEFGGRNGSKTNTL